MPEDAWGVSTLAGPTIYRKNVLAAMAAVAVSGMAYTLLWAPILLHVNVWIVPGDIWGTFRDAHMIGWGGEGALYQSDVQTMTGFISFPGMPALLAPVAMVSGALNLTESLPLTLPHPTAWLLLGPVEMIVGASVLLPLDAIAGRLSLPPRRRLTVVWLEAALVWPVVARWGHPEDLIALGLALYALMATQDHLWVRAGVLLGLALVFQPLVVVLVPLALARTPWRHWRVVLPLVLAPALGLLAAPLVHAWHTTVHVLVDQPTFPASNHPTPWIAFSTVLERAHWVRGAVVSSPLRGLFSVHTASAAVGPVVAGGPARIIPVMLSVVAAAVVWARPQYNLWLIAAICLALRCIFEPVMTPYYTVPALAMALVVGAASTRLRLAAATLAAAACTYLGYRHAATWSYYLPVTATLVAAVTVGGSSIISSDHLAGARVVREAVAGPLPNAEPISV